MDPASAYCVAQSKILTNSLKSLLIKHEGKLIAFTQLNLLFYYPWFFAGDLAPDRQSQSLYDQLKKEVTDRGMEVKETLKKFQGKVFHAVNTTHGIMLRYR